MNLNFPNPTIPTHYEDLVNRQDLRAMSFLRQRIKFDDHRRDGTDFDVETVYLQPESLEHAMLEVASFQIEQNMAPIAIALQINDGVTSQPTTTVFDCLQISTMICSRRNFTITVGTMIKQTTTWSSELRFTDKLRSTACALYAKMKNTTPEDIFKRYSITVDTQDVQGFQIQKLEIQHYLKGNFPCTLAHRVFNVKINPINATI